MKNKGSNILFCYLGDMLSVDGDAVADVEEMRIVRWMCNVKVKDRVPSKELRERLGIDASVAAAQAEQLFTPDGW